ncbi:hypothetical protein Golax_019243 [Gossypium laxum]|uniref:Pentatricopeptide repeat-containing protein n=1 Tax=Gossypium laxum TaxID=34288 RepID=A0A7J8Z6F1_9ROSI|nr:hypothetical protein [Gossypium laxum]
MLLRFSLQSTPIISPSLLPIFHIPFAFKALLYPAKHHSFSAPRVYDCNVRIRELSRAGYIKAARQLFDNMPTPDVVSWNSIITGYWQNGFLRESKKLFISMPDRNILSWNSMIAGCVENGYLDEAFQYFKAMPERNTESYNAMMSGFIRWDRVKEAEMLFQEMPRKNVISYTAMMDGYMKVGEFEKARALFDEMPYRNVVSWTVMISGYVDNGRFNEAKELYERMPNRNVVAMTAMITGYFKEGKVEDARTLFDGIWCKDLPCWNAMITGYALNGIGEEALKLCSEMVKLAIQPDIFTLVSVFTACSGLASVKEGRQMHVLVIKYGFESDASLCHSLITMYSKCGSILDAEQAFRQMNGACLVSWNTIISAFAQHGLYEKAVDFFNQMEVVGVKPDGVTFLSLLSACGHAGKVNESMDFFDLMVKEYGICPGPEHYSCLVDTLSRAGQLEKASEIIRSMPFEADAGVWGALLSACSVYLNVELGELAAKKIVEWNPHHSGAYVVLSNIYAAAGMWDEVTRVRLQMKEQGVKKQCAYSWMEIGNKVHHFLGGDISHPDTNKIHLEIKSISLQMKALVNIAEIDLLLGRVDYDLAGGAGGWFFHWMLASFVAFYLIFAGMELLVVNTSNHIKHTSGFHTYTMTQLSVLFSQEMEESMNGYEDEIGMKLSEDVNQRLFESDAMNLLSQAKKRIQELEEEIERRKESEKKMHDSFVAQSKEHKQTQISLERSKQEIKLLLENLDKSECSSEVASQSSMGDDHLERHEFELQLTKANSARALEDERASSLKAKKLAEEVKSLKSQLRSTIEAEENNQKAMDDLALALKEVKSEANETKEKHCLTIQELEKSKEEVENLKLQLKNVEAQYMETKKEADRFNNTSERLRLEAEETLLGWSGKEKGFVECIRKAEDERNAAQEENKALLEALEESENMYKIAKEENQKLRDIMKQAINEASVAKEAASIAREENSQLKDTIAKKEEALNILSQENESLKINEAAAVENIRDLKLLFCEANWETEDHHEQATKQKPVNTSSVDKDHSKKVKRYHKRSSGPLSLTFPVRASDEDSSSDYSDDPLKGSIFDVAETPESAPAAGSTPSGGTHQRKKSSSVLTDDEGMNGEEFEGIDTSHFDEEGDRSTRKKKALLRRFSDLIRRKNIPKKEQPLDQEEK